MSNLSIDMIVCEFFNAAYALVVKVALSIHPPNPVLGIVLGVLSQETQPNSDHINIDEPIKVNCA